MAIWFGTSAKKTGKSMIVWAVAGAILTFIVSTIYVNLGLFLVFGSFTGQVEFNIFFTQYSAVRIIAVIASTGTMILIKQVIFTTSPAIPDIDTDFIFFTKDLSVNFGGLTALNNVEINVKEGDIHGLIGPNGAGKTTFTNVVSGLLRPTSGEIRFKGKYINNLDPHMIANIGISRTFQKAQVLPGLNCLENVMTGCHAGIKSGMLKTMLLPGFLRKGEEDEIREKAKLLLDLVGMANLIHKAGSDLSWMECQLIQIARSMATAPKLLILDEPTAGMGFDESRMVGNIIRQIRDAGVTIILISHDMKLVMENSDMVSVLDFGEMIFEGGPEALRDNQRVLEAYLGTE
ncbi:MAG: ABC transporter ATP-binding protein [Deltaproteobacteria bacterium]|nr:ABC transporter ATP-binding protein [Deltaproteobacteria bacterium]